MNSKPVWKIEKIVLPQHADHAGVMWHGTYFNWLEESRINALSEVGISYFELIKKEPLRTVEQLEKHQCCFSAMSGGQQGKLRLAIYFAMAEVLKPRLFLVDEPYNHIDRNGKIAIRKVLNEMQERGILNETTTLVVTHDDHDSRNLPSYDKVLAVLPEVEAIGYYGAVREDGENKYENWLLGRQASSNGEESCYTNIPGCREYMIPT